MHDKNCIFCRIVKEEIPSITFYEDEEFKAFFDVAPATLGHILIIPKKHYENIFEMDEETTGKIFILTKKIATALKKELSCDGINVVQNNGIVAGQSIFHFHIHLVPRYDRDKTVVFWTEGEIDRPESEALAILLRKRLSD